VGGAAPSIPDLGAALLEISRVTLAGWLRIYGAHHKKPLGYGKSDSRFSDPRPYALRRRFGVLYMNSTLAGCFVEAVLRDRAVGAPGTYFINESEIDALNVVEVRSVRPLQLVDLRGDGLVKMRIPTDAARASAQDLGRALSLELYRHPSRPDGIVFSSRLNGSTNVAVYGRAVPALRRGTVMALKAASGFGAVLNNFDVAIRR
jgi:RES domain